MTPAPSPRTPTIDNYVVGACIGEGGFGTVYRGVHRKLARPVAIKVLHHEYCHDPMVVSRFEAEARAANRVAHPSIVRVYDFGVLGDGRAYYVMELLAGRTLRELLDLRGALPLAEAVPILRKLAEAIDAAHAAGVAHRDLKPENLFLEDNGTIRVIDFGLAKLAGDERMTTTGRIMGTPLYMSPEQCRGKDVDHRTDLYSFGAIAYHVLVGEPPFSGDPLTLALHHINDEPLPPSAREPRIAPEVDGPLLALLAKDPKRRPRPLTPLVDGLTTPAASVARPPRRISRRGALAAAAIFTAAVASFIAVRAIARDTLAPAPAGAPTYKLVETLEYSPHGANISIDGKALLILGETASTRRDFATGATATIARGHAGWLPDGRELDLRDDGIWIRAPGAAWSRLSTSADIAWSARLDRLAFIEDQRVVVYDVATGERRSVGTIDSPRAGLNMSPDGKRLIWNVPGGRLRVVGVDDPDASRILQLPAVADASGAGAAFVDDDHIAYCTDEDDQRTIRIRHLDPIGDLGTTLYELDPRVADCYTLAHAGRLLVAAYYTRPQIAKLALDERGAAPEPLALSPSARFVALSASGRQLTVSLAMRLQVVDLLTQERHDQAVSCGPPPHGHPSVEVGGLSGFYETRETTDGAMLLLYDAYCRSIGGWSFPSRSVASAPRCRGTDCVVAVREGAATHIMRLVPGKPPALLGEIAQPAPARLQLDLAPDGRAIVAVSEADDGWVAHELVRGQRVRALDLGGHTYAAIYDARGRLIVSVVDEAGVDHVLALAGSDVTPLWSSTRQRFTVRARDSHALYGELVDRRMDVFLFERVQPR